MRLLRAVISVVMWPLIIIGFPVVMVVGEPVNRYVMRLARTARMQQETVVYDADARPARAMVFGRTPPHVSLLLTLIRNPLWIALTAPGRWVVDQFRRTCAG